MLKGTKGSITHAFGGQEDISGGISSDRAGFIMRGAAAGERPVTHEWIRCSERSQECESD
jgi:hypothetical protein